MLLSLVKWWLFLLWMTRVEGLEKIWKPDELAVNHKIMKIILESCYADESLSNPIVIIGDFSESIDELPVIKLKEFYHLDEGIQYTRPLGKVYYAASKIVLIEDSPTKLASDLTLLQSTKWWDHMALFFIIEKNPKTCDNFMEMLRTTWRMNILNSIYICTDSNNTTALYTFNPIANYAPSPWKRREEVQYLHMFHQIVDSNISCEHLHYDKTKILDGYEITIIIDGSEYSELPKKMYLSQFNEYLSRDYTYLLLYGLFTSWDVTARLETVDNYDDMLKRFGDGTGDMSYGVYLSYPFARVRIPSYIWSELTAAVKLHQEVSTLTEICQLWSSSVLIAGAVTLIILLIVLTIQSHNFPLAVLNLIRLLTHTSISGNNRSHKFRIYFTTMLIFIVITNGVFHGFIVTFLIKPERVSPPQTFDELGELGYKIYSDPDGVFELRERCPKCDVKEASLIECISFAQTKLHHACIRTNLRLRPIADSLDVVKEPVRSYEVFFLNREYWPLRNRVIDGLSRIFESGLLNHWLRATSRKDRSKNQAREAEWSSPQYKPISLNDLNFAFQVLGLGLSISTIVFFTELIVAKWGQCSTIKLEILRLNRR